MSELSFASYVEAIRPFLMKHPAKEDAAMFLLNSVISQQKPDSQEKGKKKDMTKDGTLNRILRGVLPIPDDIRLATAKPHIAEQVVHYFRKEVAQDLNPHLKDDAVEAFGNLVKADMSIPDSRREKLLALPTETDLAGSLAELFIYAINRPFSKNVEDGHQKISIPLLIFTLLFGVAIYMCTMLTMIRMNEISQPLMAFAFFFAIALFLFLVGFYFFLWRRDI